MPIGRESEFRISVILRGFIALNLSAEVWYHWPILMRGLVS